MSRKIGRNDPCPCGSGQKYKRCCLNNKGYAEHNVAKKAQKEKAPFISRLALQRFIEDTKYDPESLEVLKNTFKKFHPKGDFEDFLFKSWDARRLSAMSTADIIEKLKSMNVEFDTQIFQGQAQNYISAIQLAEDYYYTQNHNTEGPDEDFIWLAISELWKRLIPNRFSLEMIDASIQEGYGYIAKNMRKDGIESWENAWNMLKTIIPPDIKSVDEADNLLPELTQSIYNWCQDFEAELYNAGLEDNSCLKKRTDYYDDFRRIFPDSGELLMHNVSISEG